MINVSTMQALIPVPGFCPFLVVFSTIFELLVRTSPNNHSVSGTIRTARKVLVYLSQVCHAPISTSLYVCYLNLPRKNTRLPSSRSHTCSTGGSMSSFISPLNYTQKDGQDFCLPCPLACITGLRISSSMQAKRSQTCKSGSPLPAHWSQMVWKPTPCSGG